MSALSWHEEPVSKHHDRDAFDCGEEALNDFLRKYARKSHDAGGAKTFLAISDADNKTVLGYYSLAPVSLEYARTPGIIKQGLARYDVPGFRLARLAISKSVQGQGFGTQLLLLAGKRCLKVASQVGGVMMMIDAKNEQVARWYANRGAVALADSPLTLMMHLATVEAALKAANKL